tara:strand:+ start:659 stop:838 length:180 start_codon:yes stop_codon:yes gene_type:complete
MTKNKFDIFLRDQRETAKIISQRIRKASRQLSFIQEDLDRFEVEVSHQVRELSKMINGE